MKKIFWMGLMLSVLLIPSKAQDSTLITNPHVSNRGQLTLNTEDNKFSWRFDTRLFLDAATYSSSQDLSGMTYAGDEFCFSNGASPRRVRFAVKANFDRKWFGEMDIDLNYNEVDLKDLYVGYNINNNMFVKIGNIKEPLTMSNNTSPRYLPFMERAMVVDALAPNRSLGVSYTYFSRHLFGSAGFFGQSIHDQDLRDANRGDDGYAGTARIAYIPINSKTQTLHIGLGGTYRTPSNSETYGNGDREVQFKTMPESYVNRMRFIDVHIENVNHYTVTGAELAYRYNRLLVQGEYLFTTVSRYMYDSDEVKHGLKDATFDGWYAEALYEIWGDHRHYNEERGSFRSGKNHGKKGTLEAGVRYSYLNMNDFHEADDPDYWITGGKSNITTTQVNWSPNNNLTFSVSYSWVNNDKWADADGDIENNGEALYKSLSDGLDFNTLQFRVMAIF